MILFSHFFVKKPLSGKEAVILGIDEFVSMDQPIQA